jgi:signal transduction histidine kinase
MVRRIASRNAGLRLGGIVLVLLMPIVVLGIFLFNSLQSNIKLTARQLNGVEMNDLLRTLVVGAAKKKILQEDIANFMERGGNLARATKDVVYFEEVSSLLRAENPDFQYIGERAIAAIEANADSSNLILDTDSETFHLAIAIAHDIPRLIHAYSSLKTAATFETAGTTTGGEKNVTLLFEFGEWLAATKRVRNSLDAATKNATNSLFKASGTRLAYLEREVDDSKGMLVASNFTPTYSASITPSFLGQSGNSVFDEGNAVWMSSSASLFESLQKRHANLTRKLQLISLGSLLAVLLGVGSAAWMFSTTLRKLDSVEDANIELEASRTELHGMAAQLQVVNEGVTNLNVELSHKMKALTEAQEEIVKRGKLSQLGQLTATIAHELRNPLGAIRTSAFTLERKIKDKDPSLKNIFTRISSGVHRCDSIITQLLDFSRSHAIVAKPSNLDDWLEALIEEEAAKLPPHVNVHVTLGLDGQEVPFDGPRLSRAVINLISNASEAMVGKGESHQYHSVAPTIEIATRLTTRGGEIAIRDYGPGIPDEVRVKIFEPLFTTKNFGTGLGLPAVENILLQHGGGIDVESQVGSGTTFTMWLPLEKHTEQKLA